MKPNTNKTKLNTANKWREREEPRDRIGKLASSNGIIALYVGGGVYDGGEFGSC